MLKSGRIRFLATFAFGLGLLFPPAWVLCLEPGGEVRMESADVACCEDEGAPAPQRALTARSPADCDGCQDVALVLCAVRATWTHGDPALASAAIVTPVHAVECTAAPLPRHGTPPPPSSARRILSATVLQI